MLKRILIICILFLTLAVLFFLFNIFSSGSLSDSFLSPLSSSENLKQVLEKETDIPKGTYGIVIKRLNNKDSYSHNEGRVFETASLYKLWVMVTVYQQIEKGQLKETDVLEQDISVLNKKFGIASSSAEQTEGTLSMTVSEALQKMITVSDNYSALLLSEKVGLSRVAAYLKSHGFTKSKVGIDGSTPVTTAGDMAIFFEKLYGGKLANKENTQKMLALLKKQQINKKLPRYLPKNVEVAHKTGEFGELAHDAGIVYLPNNEYIIVVLSENKSREKAEEQIGKISIKTYVYFSK